MEGPEESKTFQSKHIFTTQFFEKAENLSWHFLFVCFGLSLCSSIPLWFDIRTLSSISFLYGMYGTFNICMRLKIHGNLNLKLSWILIFSTLKCFILLFDKQLKLILNKTLKWTTLEQTHKSLDHHKCNDTESSSTTDSQKKARFSLSVMHSCGFSFFFYFLLALFCVFPIVFALIKLSLLRRVSVCMSLTLHFPSLWFCVLRNMLTGAKLKHKFYRNEKQEKKVRDDAPWRREMGVSFFLFFSLDFYFQLVTYINADEWSAHTHTHTPLHTYSNTIIIFAGRIEHQKW